MIQGTRTLWPLATASSNILIPSVYGRRTKESLSTPFRRSIKFLVNHLVEEPKIIFAIIQSPTHTIFNKVLLRSIKSVISMNATSRFYHPELCKVARRIGILGTERWSEGVNLSQRSGTEFAFRWPLTVSEVILPKKSSYKWFYRRHPSWGHRDSWL